MKGCFYLQRKFAPIGHTIIKHLHTLGVEEFCAYVSMRTAYDFLVSQKEISYTKLLLDEDIHKRYKNETVDFEYLAWLEKEYGLPNLWPYLYIDRIIMNGQLVREYPHDAPTHSYYEMLQCLQVTAKEIIKFLDEEKPDFLFISVIGSLGALLLYEVSKKKGVQIINLDYIRIGNKEILTEDYRTFTWANKLFEQFQGGRIKSGREDEARYFITKFRKNPAPYVVETGIWAPRPTTRLKQLQYLSPVRIAKTVVWFTLFTLRYLVKKNKDYTDEVPWFSLWDKIKRKARELRGFGSFYSVPDFEKDFAYFPLHLEPEIATLLYAPFFSNQIHLIQQIARSLPIHFTLYVKEHPSMVGFRPRKYYKEVKKIPNVKILNPDINGLVVIKKANIIFTIAGTAGWEAVLLEKPVITFGDVFYNTLSTVKRSVAIEDLPALTLSQLKNFAPNDKELVHFVSALLEDSADANLVELWEKEDQGEDIRNRNEGLIRLAELIAKKINLTNEG